MADTGIIRSIGDFQAEVTVQEQHTDEMTITSHPVERGANITDHAFKIPAQLTIEAGWSAAGYSSGGLPLTLNDLYAALLSVQTSATLLTVQTGKRLYNNMLIKSMKQTTDQKNEYTLLITLVLQEIFLVDTVAVTIPSNSVMKDAQSTGNTTSTGSKTLKASGCQHLPFLFLAMPKHSPLP